MEIIDKTALPENELERCILDLLKRYVSLQEKEKTLQQEIICMEAEKARLTRECSDQRKNAERWKKSADRELELLRLVTSKALATIQALIPGNADPADQCILQRIEEVKHQLHSLEEKMFEF